MPVCDDEICLQFFTGTGIWPAHVAKPCADEEAVNAEEQPATQMYEPVEMDETEFLAAVANCGGGASGDDEF